VIFKWKKKKKLSRVRDIRALHLLTNRFRELAPWSESTTCFYTAVDVVMVLGGPFGLLNKPAVMEILIYRSV